MRAQSRVGLKSVSLRIVDQLNAFVRKDMLELKGYVTHVEYGPEVAEVANSGDDAGSD